MTAKDLWLWLLLAWLWGSSFLAIGIGVETLDPVSLVAGRMGIGAICLIAFLFLRGGNLALGARGWIIATVVGLTGNVIPFLLISFAEQQVDSGLAALIMGIAPVVTLTLAPLIHPDETLTTHKIFGAVIGFGGVAVLVGPSAFKGIGGDLIPQIALIWAALFYSLTALISRRYSHPIPLQMSAASVLIGAVAICLLAAMNHTNIDLPSISVRSLVAVVYLGIGPTALAALIYFYLIPRIGAARLQQVNYLVPVLGSLLGMVFLNEKSGLNTLFAIILIVFAVYLVSANQPFKRRSPS